MPMNKAIQLNKGEIIKDGVNYFFIFCALGSVIYVNPVLYVNSSPVLCFRESIIALPKNRNYGR